MYMHSKRSIYVSIFLHYHREFSKASSEAIDLRLICWGLFCNVFYLQSRNVKGPDKIALKRSADLDLQCFQNRICLGLSYLLAK